ncbi:MAG: VCBS repeat-containing protein [Candidatus Stahlbacteria bacterium]|nr:VCBS repeat-containing protein [Candidatus Stahlbacteria bacterium]
MEIVAGDLNNDGWVDAVSNHSNNDSASQSFIAVHTNNGGTFSTTTSLPIGACIRQMRIVDIDGNGWRDIVITAEAFKESWQSETGVYWYRNNGGMNFTRFFLGKCNAWKVYCVDFNGDNHLEIVVTEEVFGPNETSDCRLILFKNNGGETFTAQIIDPDIGMGLAAALGGSGVVCADFDEDLDIDIICGSSDYGNIYLYKNNGSWPNPTFLKSTIDVTASRVDGMDMCDFDLDGDMDFVACGRNYWVAWYENLAPASPGNFYKHIFDTEWRYFDLPHTTYLDGDSCCDIVLSVAGSGTDGRFVAYLSPCSTAAVEENKYTYGTNWLKVPTIIRSGFAKIEYSIQERGEVRLDVMDIAGRTVQVIEQEYCSQPGVYRTAWNINKEPNGIYFVRLIFKNMPSIVKKVSVIRNR